MKKKLLLLSILLTGGLFVSCSSDESGDNTPETSHPSPITITKVPSEFLITGENLEITGTNFINKDFPTKVFINDIEITPKEITNSKILISNSDAFKTGANILKIQVQKVSSTPINFFVIAKGWNKLNTLGNVNINNSSIFDDSKTIFSFINENLPVKLEPKASGYEQASINQPGYYGAFKMFNDKIGVLTNTRQATFTDNGFETTNKIVPENNFSIELNGLYIGYLDSKSSIINTVMGAQIYTADNGKTFVKNDYPMWATTVIKNGGNIRLNVKSFGKSTSNDKFYQLGRIYDPKKYGSNIQKNAVMESETGYSNWIIKDTISNADTNLSLAYKFLNINKILSINNTDKTLQQSNDMLKTWTKIKSDVTSIFLRTETQWYIQSGDKLFVTKDSGATWELELELPTGSVINDISFSKTKIIISGNKGLHYLKLE
ncbi:hypothetical protein [Flavobacterium sp. AJR]|jgi:hypothetical protein|uniref:hypothetical protein n=1 Tax=Flavobacterium sp. AJR TaxID=1979369 RepID=UPI000A3D8643|nr:hypothetical protein [Flavobacterium sp. AJR]OUL64089.1 hypothetical protein B8T70_01235 [Flavobacterium sp. AJR]